MGGRTMKNCRNCAESDLIDNEIDLYFCTRDGETVSGNNSCCEWTGEETADNDNKVKEG
jgi:hypothetical protein